MTPTGYRKSFASQSLCSNVLGAYRIKTCFVETKELEVQAKWKLVLCLDMDYQNFKTNKPIVEYKRLETSAWHGFLKLLSQRQQKIFQDVARPLPFCHRWVEHMNKIYITVKNKWSKLFSEYDKNKNFYLIWKKSCFLSSPKQEKPFWIFFQFM